MVYFQIKLTDHILENIKKICQKNDIFIEEFLMNTNHKNLHSRLIDDLEDYIRKNYSDRLKIKNCLVDLQNYHNILCDIASSSQKYQSFIIKKNLNTKSEMNELIFTYNHDNLFIK